MKIPVLGMDPSMSNWGLASAQLDLSSGHLTDPVLTLVSPKKATGKQVRVNSSDLQRAEELAAIVMAEARKAKAVFVEVPVGSKSARAMASYGICVGILGTLRAEGIPLVEVTPTEVKLALTSSKNATKDQMINAASKLYPDSNWPQYRGGVAKKSEHLADAIGTIHAGVHTPLFKNIMRMLEGS